MKVCLLGCGLRTPLLLHGLIHSPLRIAEITLYDLDGWRAELMANLGGEIAGDRVVRLHACARIEQAIEGSAFVISSIRVGGMEGRARDERLALECGFAGQETTGPAGFAMALRTIPVALDHARIVERLAPHAWIISLTNPAGIVTEAISQHTAAHVVGVCDTPSELIFQIARALGAGLDEVDCDYAGLNHLGWIRSVRVRGEDALDTLLGDDRKLRGLYPAQLFSPDLIRKLRLIPTEYVFFYYDQQVARRNQERAHATRGEELAALNRKVWLDLQASLESDDARAALAAYRRYLNRRNASYLKLEGAAESAFDVSDPDWDPFAAESGYHRIAVDTICALLSDQPRRMILNVSNCGAISDFRMEDVVEVPCMVDRTGPQPLAIGSLPEAIRGLMYTVKQYERLTIQGALSGNSDTTTLALMTNPIVASWEAAGNFLRRLVQSEMSRGTLQ